MVKRMKMKQMKMKQMKMKPFSNHKPLRQMMIEPWFIFVLIFGIYYGAVTIFNTGTRCVYKNLFGIPCPGCGMTRSYVHVLEGNWKGAFYDHPLFITVPIIIVVSWILFKFNLNPRVYKVLSGILIFIAILFILLYIVRMVLYFPDTDPLKFYDRGLYPTLFRHLKNLFIQ